MNQRILSLTLVAIAFTSLGVWHYKKTHVTEKEIYVNRLIYLKEDSSLYTGTLTIRDDASTYDVQFKNGIPTGAWSEYDHRGRIFQEGRYIDAKTLSEETKKFVQPDTFVVDDWQESEVPSSTFPSHLTISILKNDIFFNSEMARDDVFPNTIAQEIFSERRKSKYAYIHVSYVNSLYAPTKIYSIEYKIVNGELQKNERDTSTNAVQTVAN